MPTRRNPVARSPLLRKGGAHTSSPSGQRRQRNRQVQDEIDEWLDDGAGQHRPRQSAPPNPSTVQVLRGGEPSGMVEKHSGR